MSKSDEYVILAFERGYRISTDGFIINKWGKAKTGRLHNGTHVRFNLRITQDHTVQVYAHRLAGYQKFGAKLFEPGNFLYHYNKITTDNSSGNIKLRTPENPRRYIKKVRPEWMIERKKKLAFQWRRNLIKKNPNRKVKKM